MAEACGTNIWDFKFPFCVVPEEWTANAEEWKVVNEDVTKIIADDFTKLMSSPKLRAGFLGVRCDWKARKEIHNLKRHYMCNLICDRCLACKPHVSAERSYLCVGLDAGWRETERTNAEYQAEAKDGQRLSPWFLVPGAHVDLFHFDLMHVLFLGTSW